MICDFCRSAEPCKFVWFPVIHIRIEGEEAISVIERSEELTTHFIDTFWIKLEVLPRAGVGKHIPAHGIGSVGIECTKRIDGIAETFRHLIAVLIEHESVGDDVFVCHSAFDHRVDSMKGKEPSACLVHTFGDEVGGARCVCVLEGIVILCVRHRAGVEPYIDEIEFALHRFATR